MENFILKPLVVGKLSLFLGMYKDALMHFEGSKGWGLTTKSFNLIHHFK